MFSQFLRLSPHFAPALQLKRMLSANAEAPLNIECIMEDADVRGKLTREELEVICAPLFDRFKAPIEKVGGVDLAEVEGLRAHVIRFTLTPSPSPHFRLWPTRA